MPSETASKRAKKLVNQLFELQLYDLELTAPFCLSTKHYLRSSKHCRAVEVLADPDTAFTLDADQGSIQKFILSQLEAQRLTNQDPSPTILISPLVHFVLSCIPTYLSRENTVATLFHWQSLSTHRTFCIFAFVDNTAAMPSSTYTVQELIGLRSNGVPMSLPEAPQKGVNLASHSGSGGRHTGSESRTLGRLHRYRAHHSQQTAPLRVKDDHSGTSGEVMFVRQQQRRDARVGLPAEMEWRYRGRAGSEAASSVEPLSAPTGLSAQKSEGFQRFYKAVISPTHVRVTAGGRIVPNTRGTSPMSKRPKDEADESGNIKNGSQQADDQVQQLHDNSYLAAPKAPAMPMFAFPSHPFYPSFPAPMPAMQMMPMPMGLGFPGGFPFPHQSLANNVPASSPPELSKPLAKENRRSSKRREMSEFKAPTFDNTDEKPRRLPSEQLDHTKPIVINGQVVYPFPAPAFPPHLTAGPQPQFPPSFAGHPSFPVNAFHNSTIGPPSAVMNPMLGPSFNFSAIPGSLQVPPVNPGQNGPSTLATAAAPSPSTVLQPPAAPPISSIRPSEISRKQIEMLRSSLKYHEDQLLYNRHQIDEKEMEHTIQMLQSQIDRFEALNQSQLRFEESHYPKKETKVAEPTSLPSRSSDRTSQTDGPAQGAAKYASNSNRRADSLRHKPFLRKRETCFNLDPVETSFLLPDPVKKSTLTTAAALAPPFEPRAPLNFGKTAATHNGAGMQWDGTAVDHSVVNNGNRSSNAVNTAGQVQSRSSSSTESQSDLGKPYLVGTLPAGINPQSARDSDYVYERDLTQDEVRSRYLYWGKAPYFTRKGLPKFDGKDFYPASPGQDAVRESSPPPLLTRRIPIGDPNVDYSTEAFRPRSAQYSRPAISGPYASNFSINRQKPVKVTLRRPEVDGARKRHQVNEQSLNVVEAAAGRSDRRDKQELAADNTRTKFLHSVLRRNISSNSEVLPSALTSATAQGILPQYSTGYDSLMAASLSPINSSPITLGHLSPGKSDEGGRMIVTPASRKIGENRPPPDGIGPASLEDQFRGLVSFESKHDTALPVHWRTPL